MAKTIAELQERYETLVNEQEGILNRSESMEGDQKRGFKDGEEARFDAITTELKTIKKDIERQRQVEQARMEAGRFEAPAVHTNPDNKREASYERAFAAAATGDWSKAGPEKELMQENARFSPHQGDNNRTLYINPYDMVRTDAFSVVGTAGDGGNLVGTQYQPEKLVEQLWNASIIGKLPVVRERSTQFKSIAVSTNKPTARMVGETAALGDSEKLTFDLLTVSPKEMITKGAFSRQADLQTAPGIRNLMQRYVFNAIADKLDVMFINGSGTAPILKGILAHSNGATDRDATIVTLASNALTYAKLVEMYTALAKKNVGGELQWIMNAQVVGKLMTTLKDTANTNSGYIITDMEKNLNGHRIVQSQTVPANLGAGTNRAAVILGKFDETEVHQFGNIAIEFDNTSGADNSLIYLRSYSFWDFLHKRPGNYAFVNDAAY